jgi:hypothetical protein
VPEGDDPTIVLTPWTGPWPEDDPDANFKADVALYALTDPLSTLRNLGDHLGIPVGGLCHYVLAKWATAGSDGLLELGPTMTERLAGICDEAEAAGTDDARLAAYAKLRGILSWLRAPLDQG